MEGLKYFILHQSTYDGNLNQWISSKVQEELVALWIETVTNISPIERISEGFNPEWDFYHKNGAYSEVKVSLKKDNEWLLEISKADGRQSGLSATKSHFYIIITIGWNSKIHSQVGKVRMIHTADLKQYVEEHKEHYQTLTLSADTSQNSRCISFAFRSLQYDGWIGDIPIVWQNGNPIGYDFDPDHTISVNRHYRKIPSNITHKI